MDQGAEIGGEMAQDFKGCEDLEVEENIKWLNSSMSVIIYQEHIELLEEENEELQQEVLILKQRLKYYENYQKKEKILNN